MYTSDQQEKADHYILNKMTASEKEAFEAQLITDPELKILIKERQLLIRGINAGFNKEFKEKLKNKDLNLNRISRIRKIQYFSGIAAAVVTGLVLFVLLSSIKPDLVEVYAEYYKPYPNINTPLSRSQDNTTNPFYLYETGNYKEAQQEFNIILKSQPDNEAALFYSGIICMEMNDFQNAINLLQKLDDNKNNKFYRPSKWYLALCFIHMEDKEKAVEYLHMLREENDLYRKNAEEIVKKLN